MSNNLSSGFFIKKYAYYSINRQFEIFARYVTVSTDNLKLLYLHDPYYYTALYMTFQDDIFNTGWRISIQLYSYGPGEVNICGVYIVILSGMAIRLRPIYTTISAEDSDWRHSHHTIPSVNAV